MRAGKYVHEGFAFCTAFWIVYSGYANGGLAVLQGVALNSEWERRLYVFGLPVLAFLLEILMRRLIKAASLKFEDWCYGADLGFAGITTGIACLPQLKKPDLVLVSLTLFVALTCWILPMILHQAYEPKLESAQRRELLIARSLLAAVGNLVGLAGMWVVLTLIWTY
jgi:hypothetical protein